MKRFFYYILFPYILLMRGLYRFIKTEGTMFYAFMLFFVPIHILIIGYSLPVSLLLETLFMIYLSAGLFTPMYYFESDVKRRRTKPGYVPIDETK